MNKTNKKINQVKVRIPNKNSSRTTKHVLKRNGGQKKKKKRQWTILHEVRKTGHDQQKKR